MAKVIASIDASLHQQSKFDSEQVELAKWLLQQRSSRSALLVTMDIDEPAWAMMLDLFITGRTGGVPTTSLCLTSGIPISTALRSIVDLTSKGIVNRTRDSLDKRRILVSLNEASEKRISSYLKGVASDVRELSGQSHV